MNELINTKQIFLDTVNDFLTTKGFLKIDDGYEKKEIHQLPGQVISINGRRMEQPGQMIESIKSILYVGDGWCADEFEENTRDFTQLKITIVEGDQKVLDHEEAFYWDDVDYLIKILQQITQ